MLRRLDNWFIKHTGMDGLQFALGGAPLIGVVVIALAGMGII